MPSAPASLPAPPPTPPVPLSALLARGDLGLVRLAGPEEADVHWAQVSEMADPLPYLLGGELLLTAGVQVPPSAGAAWFDAYVERILAAGGAALGFGVAPVHDTVPGELVAACEAHGLPLLEVPRRTTFSAVARAVGELVARARLADLRRVAEAQRSLASAASRPDPVPSVLRQLAAAMEGWAVLFGPSRAAGGGAADAWASEAAGGPADPSGGGAGVGAADPAAGGSVGGPSVGGPSGGWGNLTAGRDPGPRVRAALTELARVVRPAPAGSTAPGGTAPAPSSATDTADGLHLSAYALGTTPGYVLGLATGRREAGDHTIASAASVLLTLLTGERGGGPEASWSAALVRLLLGAGPQEVAPLLGGERWTLVHARPGAGASDAASAAALGEALGSPLIDLVDPAGRVDRVVRVLVPDGRPVERQTGWTLGVAEVTGPDDWPAVDDRAARALGRALATRSPLVRHGSGGRLVDLLPPHEAEEHARALLAPITGTPALPRTLRAWLSLHGSWDRTAVALSVHRNTVRQRIARCAALLETDLDDPDVRMELWFALRRLPD
ncbi:PucR family transcriptional regulator ligand-binding domain-containing protein [Streptomyces sp. NPDC056600]|uniref:PucR family transcriptional regulator ligand-binding domain-containing protein n=1 Tax=Streptomyces sp. NPDC056600 TaxID=3345874 RepID=UPI0036B4600A